MANRKPAAKKSAAQSRTAKEREAAAKEKARLAAIDNPARPAVRGDQVYTGDAKLDELAALLQGLPDPPFQQSLRIKMGESFAQQLGLDDEARATFLLAIGR